MHDRVRDEVFRYVAQVTQTAGAASLNIAPGSFPRLNSIADSYSLYRFKELRYRILPNTTISGLQSASYLPGAVDTPPSTTTTINEIVSTTVLGQRQTNPSDWVVLRAGDLSGYLSWYKTVIGTPDPIDEVQGAIYIVGNGVEVCTLEIRGVCSFKNQVATANTPMLREVLLRKERERLLYILSSSSKTETGSPLSSRQLTGK